MSSFSSDDDSDVSDSDDSFLQHLTSDTKNVKEFGRSSELEVYCNLCGKKLSTITVHEKMVEINDSTVIMSQMKSVLENFYNEHFGLGSVADINGIGCPSVNSYDLNKMIEVRDLQWLQIGIQEHNLHIDKELFARLMQLTMSTHLESKQIIQYFNWISVENEGT